VFPFARLRCSANEEFCQWQLPISIRPLVPRSVSLGTAARSLYWGGWSPRLLDAHSSRVGPPRWQNVLWVLFEPQVTGGLICLSFAWLLH
jgi:hypothetical protein